MKIDTETGELLPVNIMPLTDKAPALTLDLTEVVIYHKEPMKLVEKINAQAGYMVFDVKNKKGRDACRSHAAQIIKCITPACNESKRLADEAKKVVNQDLFFRKTFEAGIREIAEYHRKPLTEWEHEQEKIAEIARLEAEKIENERLYQLDWDDAIEANELFDLRKEKAKRDAEKAAIEELRRQEEYDRQLQEQAILKERERQEKEVLVNGEKLPQLCSPTITISISDYKKLVDDINLLYEIVELWNQASRMTESANRAESFSIRNAEIRDAQKVRLAAIALIEGIK